MKYLVAFFLISFIHPTMAQEECGSWSENWYLREINIDKNSIYLSPNEEVINVTLQCPYSSTGEFITVFCGTGNGMIQQAESSFTFINQEFIISDDVCNEMPNNEIEDLYFSFFTNNIEESFFMEQWHIWGSSPPGPEEIGFLQIFAPNGDYLLFEDYPLNLLNTDEFTRQATLVIPNPIKNEFQLIIAQQYQLNSLSIINGAGVEIEKLDTSNLDSINVGHLSSGLYFLKLTNDKGNILYKKIIKD